MKVARDRSCFLRETFYAPFDDAQSDREAGRRRCRTASMALDDSQKPTPCQIAVQVRDVAEARRFYQGLLGCVEGRTDEQRLILDLYGHHFVCHLDPQLGRQGRTTVSAMISTYLQARGNDVRPAPFKIPRGYANGKH
jgi:hypothetical protein